jgi:hypothetical protein
MSKVTIAFVSFIAGICSVLVLSLADSHTPTWTQPAFAQAPRGVVIGGAEPVVPPLGPLFTNANLSKLEQSLDGFHCEHCTFTDVTFTYAGGATLIVDPKFVGTMEVKFKGPAQNALLVIAFLQAMGQNQRPPAFNPNAPTIKRATAKEVFNADLITPPNQK